MLLARRLGSFGEFHVDIYISLTPLLTRHVIAVLIDHVAPLYLPVIRGLYGCSNDGIVYGLHLGHHVGRVEPRLRRSHVERMWWNVPVFAPLHALHWNPCPVKLQPSIHCGNRDSATVQPMICTRIPVRLVDCPRGQVAPVHYLPVSLHKIGNRLGTIFVVYNLLRPVVAVIRIFCVIVLLMPYYNITIHNAQRHGVVQRWLHDILIGYMHGALAALPPYSLEDILREHPRIVDIGKQNALCVRVRHPTKTIVVLELVYPRIPPAELQRLVLDSITAYVIYVLDRASLPHYVP